MQVAIVLHSPHHCANQNRKWPSLTRIFIKTLVLDWPITFFATTSQSVGYTWIPTSKVRISWHPVGEASHNSFIIKHPASNYAGLHETTWDNYRSLVLQQLHLLFGITSLGSSITSRLLHYHSGASGWRLATTAKSRWTTSCPQRTGVSCYFTLQTLLSVGVFVCTPSRAPSAPLSAGF